MNLDNNNIEAWFLQRKESEFPDGHDYVAKYRTIRDYIRLYIHPEIKAIVKEYLPDSLLNDHGERHIAKVIDRATDLLKDNSVELSPYETFFLLLSIQIHDAGHIINGRKEHEKNARKIISKFDNTLISTPERKYISAIACAHSGKNNPIGNLHGEDIVYIFSTNVRIKLIASILRLADELADDFTRTSVFLREKELIMEESQIFHEFSACLDSCKALTKSKEIKMIFYLESKHISNPLKKNGVDIFLIDEIYERTLKTFTECLYCNRFLPESARINMVSVEINFCDKDGEDFFRKVSYRIEEQDYPIFPKEFNIFSFCEKDLIDDGNKMTGKYLSEKLTIFNMTKV